MSDRTGRVPKGTMVRPAPDWFDDNMGMGGFGLAFPQPSLENYVAVQLFNNDQEGRLLKVYGIYANNDGGGGFGFFFIGNPIGTQQPGPSALRPDKGVPAGQIWMADTLGVAVNTPNPYLPLAIPAAIGVPGFDSNTVFSPFPMFVVPQGFTLVGTNLTTASTPGCYFWYQVSAT